MKERRRGAFSWKAIGVGVAILALALVALYFGITPGSVVRKPAVVPQKEEAALPSFSPEEQELADFVSVVLADTEDTWHELFRRNGNTYREPRLVLFSGEVQSACGSAQAAVGPFYCSADERVYIDLSFFRELRERFPAPGDFAQAYVIAHQIGHHVQTLTGAEQRVSAMRRRLSPREANALLVRQELQADCYAGVWAHQANRSRGVLEAGDIEEGLDAATAIGDDRLRRKSQGRAVPDPFTHSTSAQRARWFRQGLEHGDMESCDTFNVGSL